MGTPRKKGTVGGNLQCVIFFIHVFIQCLILVSKRLSILDESNGTTPHTFKPAQLVNPVSSLYGVCSDQLLFCFLLLYVDLIMSYVTILTLQDLQAWHKIVTLVCY